MIGVWSVSRKSCLQPSLCTNDTYVKRVSRRYVESRAWDPGTMHAWFLPTRNAGCGIDPS